jgi:RNA polymerase sigma-70 factor (family 1)
LQTQNSHNKALQALLNHKEEGLEFFFEEYYSPLVFFANKLIHDTCLAEEISADAFIKLWEKREELSMEGSIKSWLYATVRNSCIDHLRKVRRMHISEQGLQTVESVEQSVLHKLIETETLKEITRTMELLPPKCRQVFRLFYIHGKNYQEIAKELRLSPLTVRNQKQRAVRLLKEMMGPVIVFVVFSICFYL